MDEQKQVDKNWLEAEAEELNKQTSFTGERLPSLQFEENKVIRFTVDFEVPFGAYDDTTNKCVKAIIPVEQNGVKKILWLNKKNPLYKDLVYKGREGQREFAVIQTGNKASTKYSLVEEGNKNL